MKQLKTTQPADRRYLREFISCVINKDFSRANKNLTEAVREKIKARTRNILKEIE